LHEDSFRVSLEWGLLPTVWQPLVPLLSCSPSGINNSTSLNSPLIESACRFWYDVFLVVLAVLEALLLEEGVVEGGD
jgi:hypothetical protein